ncbi:hypothetical protein [Streptomyces sp. AC550_RSS872]|uniref:hypothetical protein n=1 Tax=Streptomyces sp. AC550_RSS872 TaxID=2823689 RepID=UPI001C2687F1|nr:hypothetical protein [Streptomyces sp. AC550_RSS872]
MRVTTRTTTRSTRARWGARCVGLGLATALAVGFGAGPAAAAAVNPVFVPNNPPLACPDDAEGFRLPEDDGGDPEDATVPVTVDGTSGTVVVNFSDDLTQVSFNTTGNLAIRQVTVKGANNANRYTYDANSTPMTFPDGIASDTGLVAPPNPGGTPEISHVDFCVIEGDGS